MRRAAFLALAAAVLAAGCGAAEEVRPLPEGVEGTIPAETEPEPEPEPEEPAPEEGDAEAGGQVFASAGCGACHTLADANATGTIGVNLDERQPTAAEVEQAVRTGPDAMPSFEDQLSDEEIQNVSAYVSQAAGG